MRILWLTPGFAAGPQDYNCIPPLQALARALTGQGVELHIIALEYPFVQAPYAFGPAATPASEGAGALPAGPVDPLQPVRLPGGEDGMRPAGGATVYPCDGRNRRWLRWRTRARALDRAAAILAEKKCDALHSFWLGPAWALGVQLAARHRLPHWTTLMGQDALPQNRFLPRLEPAAAASLIALTPFHRDALKRATGLQAAHCIPWGLEAADIAPADSSARRTDVLGVGSLLPVKDWVRWLRVLRRIADVRPDLRAELIGSGPEARRLRHMAGRLGLGDRLQCCGDLPRPEVLARMRQSRALLHTARFEAFGMVLAEAPANGCRVVSTPVGVAPALGACADTDEALAAAVLYALDAPPTPFIRKPLMMEDTAAQYLKLYNTCV